MDCSLGYRRCSSGPACLSRKRHWMELQWTFPAEWHERPNAKGSSIALLGVVLCTSLRVGIQKSGFYMYLLGGERREDSPTNPPIPPLPPTPHLPKKKKKKNPPIEFQIQVESSELYSSQFRRFCTDSTSVEVGRGIGLHQWKYMPQRFYELTPYATTVMYVRWIILSTNLSDTTATRTWNCLRTTLRKLKIEWVGMP